MPDKRNVNWNSIRGWIAIILSVFATFFAFRSSQHAQESARVAMKPHIDIITDMRPSKEEHGLFLKNTGSGPAIVFPPQVYLRGKYIGLNRPGNFANSANLMYYLEEQKKDPNNTYEGNFISFTIAETLQISPGDEIPLFTIDNYSESARTFINAQLRGMSFRVKYKSTIDNEIHAVNFFAEDFKERPGPENLTQGDEFLDGIIKEFLRKSESK